MTTAKWNTQIELPTDPQSALEAATKQYVDAGLATKAPLDSATLTGVPTTPTAVLGTNTNQIASTAFVQQEIAGLSGGSSETGASILTKLAPVDGAGSGLDADLLDGQEGSYYLNAANLTGTVVDARLPTTMANKILTGATHVSNFRVITSGGYNFFQSGDGTGTSGAWQDVVFTPYTTATAYFRIGATAAYINGNAVWHAGNFDPASTVVNYARQTLDLPSAGSASANDIYVSGLAQYKNDTGTPVGAIVFSAPDGRLATMHNLLIRGTNYISGTSFDMHVAGYKATATSGWTQYSKANFTKNDIQTRLAVDANGNNCVILGDVGTSWSYPHIVMDGYFGFSGANESYGKNWTVALVTDLSAYTYVSPDIADSGIQFNPNFIQSAGVSAAAGLNASYWLRDELGASKGVWYWSRSTDQVILRKYKADGSTYYDLTLSDTTVSWKGTALALIDDSVDVTSTLAGGPIVRRSLAGATAAGSPHFTWGGNTGSGMRQAAVNIIAFDTGSIERVRISSSGLDVASGTLSEGGNAVWHAANFVPTNIPSQTATLAFTSGNGKGINFWANASYAIYMSSAPDATYGGRVTGETTSDYNMYFKMNGGTNRGFVFVNGTTPVAGIDAGGNLRINGGFEGNTLNVNRVVAGYDSGIANSINCSGWFRTTGSSGLFFSSYGGGVYMTDTTYVKTYSNGTKPMMASDFVISSDERLKTGIRDLNYRGRLRPVNFSWIADGKPDIGFIAQEVVKLYPEVVGHTRNDDGDDRLILSYPRLTAVLAHQANRAEDAIVELREKNAVLTAEVDDLKAKLAQVMTYLGLS